MKIFFVSVMLLTSWAAAAVPLSGSFTYQGEFRDAGVPADGSYDFEFELFDAELGGTKVGGTVSLDNVAVNNGIFSVELPFGTSPFAGDQLWIEIGVRDGASSGGYQGLAPRQKLTASPYALHALNAESVDFVSPGSHTHAGQLWSGSFNSSFNEVLHLRNQGTGRTLYLENTNVETLLPVLEVEARRGWGARIRGDGDLGRSPLEVISEGNISAIRAVNSGSGLALIGDASSGDALLVSSDSGDLIRGFDTGPSSNLRFRVTNEGNVSADGTFTGGGADVAEFIDSPDELEPGDVVAIGSKGQFRRVNSAGSTAVAGVITTHPGLLMNADDSRQTLEDGPALALVGRVPVKVTDQGGVVRPGDLLVSSSTPGHAMRAPVQPLPGTVIGKSLGTHESGAGAVEILVMLR